MAKVKRKNEFDKPVYEVNNLHIKRVDKLITYELQLNDQYFELTEEQIQAIKAIAELPHNIGISVG